MTAETTHPQTNQANAATEADGYACATPPSDIQRRRNQGEALRGHLQDVTRIEAGVVLTFAAGTEEEVRSFVADESACCPFFTFEVTGDEQAVRLTVTAPADSQAQELIDQLAASFAAGTDAAGNPTTATS